MQLPAARPHVYLEHHQTTASSCVPITATAIPNASLGDEPPSLTSPLLWQVRQEPRLGRTRCARRACRSACAASCSTGSTEARSWPAAFWGRRPCAGDAATADRYYEVLWDGFDDTCALGVESFTVFIERRTTAGRASWSVASTAPKTEYRRDVPSPSLTCIFPQLEANWVLEKLGRSAQCTAHVARFAGPCTSTGDGS